MKSAVGTVMPLFLTTSIQVRMNAKKNHKSQRNQFKCSLTLKHYWFDKPA